LVKNVMDHNFAIENRIAERYLLRDLTEAERADFEEHYFECPECAKYVGSGDEFVHLLQEIKQESSASGVQEIEQESNSSDRRRCRRFALRKWKIWSLLCRKLFVVLET